MDDEIYWGGKAPEAVVLGKSNGMRYLYNPRFMSNTKRKWLTYSSYGLNPLFAWLTDLFTNTPSWKMVRDDRDVKLIPKACNNYQNAAIIGFDGSLKNQCAKWVQNNTGVKNRIPAAWAILKGTKYVINGASPYNGDYSRLSMLQHLYNSADFVKDHLDINKLDPNKKYLVNMYYATSPKMSSALYEGHGLGSHLGILTYNNGAWKVLDEVGGNFYEHDLNDMLGGGKQAGIIGIFDLDDIEQ